MPNSTVERSAWSFSKSGTAQFGAWLMLMLLLSGCLPGDQRPEPGTLQVDVRRSLAAEGFTTDDGWTITFARFVTALANEPLRGQDCTDYSRTRYDRLYDFAVSGEAKVGLHYGLGRCRSELTIGIPTPLALLMDGTTQDDLDLMSVGINDLEDLNDIDVIMEFGNAVGLLVRATAARDGVTKHMSWLLRRSHDVSECVDAQETLVNRFTLSSGDNQQAHVLVRPEELFRVGVEPDAPILFDIFAEADVDGDDDISQAELRDVKLPAELFGQEYPDELDVEISLEAALTNFLFARVLTYEGARTCSSDLGGLPF